MYIYMYYAWKLKISNLFLTSVEHDISLVRFAHM